MFRCSVICNPARVDASEKIRNKIAADAALLTVHDLLIPVADDFTLLAEHLTSFLLLFRILQI